MKEFDREECYNSTKRRGKGISNWTKRLSELLLDANRNGPLNSSRRAPIDPGTNGTGPATPSFKAETSTASNLDPLAPELVEPALDLESEPASPFERLLFGFKDRAGLEDTAPLWETAEIAGLKLSPRSLW